MIKNYYILYKNYQRIKKINNNFITKKIKNDLYNCLNLKSIY